jgi:methylglyoxal synthase
MSHGEPQSRTSRLVVGEVEGGFALLTTTEQHIPVVFRIPLTLLPHDVDVGVLHSM